MIFKFIKLFLLLFLLVSKLGYAQPSAGAGTVSEFLMITTEQQEIYLSRYIQANPKIASECTPGWDINKTLNYFIDWANNNPQFLRRNLTSAFTTALMDACKLNQKGK